MEDPPPLKTTVVMEPADTTENSYTDIDMDAADTGKNNDTTAASAASVPATGEKPVDDMNNEELDQELEKVRIESPFRNLNLLLALPSSLPLSFENGQSRSFSQLALVPFFDSLRNDKSLVICLVLDAPKMVGLDFRVA